MDITIFASVQFVSGRELCTCEFGKRIDPLVPLTACCYTRNQIFVLGHRKSNGHACQEC